MKGGNTTSTTSITSAQSVTVQATSPALPTLLEGDYMPINYFTKRKQFLGSTLQEGYTASLVSGKVSIPAKSAQKLEMLLPSGLNYYALHIISKNLDSGVNTGVKIGLTHDTVATVDPGVFVYALYQDSAKRSQESIVNLYIDNRDNEQAFVLDETSIIKIQAYNINEFYDWAVRINKQTVQPESSTMFNTAYTDSQPDDLIYQATVTTTAASTTTDDDDEVLENEPFERPPWSSNDTRYKVHHDYTKVEDCPNYGTPAFKDPTLPENNRYLAGVLNDTGNAAASKVIPNSQTDTPGIVLNVALQKEIDKDSTGEGIAVGLAIAGRCKCKVSGVIKKGDELVADGKGGAQSVETDGSPKASFNNVIGKALADFNGIGGIIDIKVV